MPISENLPAHEKEHRLAAIRDTNAHDLRAGLDDHDRSFERGASGLERQIQFLLGMLDEAREDVARLKAERALVVHDLTLLTADLLWATDGSTTSVMRMVHEYVRRLVVLAGGPAAAAEGVRTVGPANG